MSLAINGGEKFRKEPLPIRKTMGNEEIDAVVDVMKEDNISEFLGGPHELFFGGKKVLEFEKVWSETFNYKHSITFNSWTSGLLACVGALDIGPGDEVIVTPYTMSASATVIMFYGGIPIFADIDPVTLNIDPVSVEKNITENTKAIMVVHLFGRPADMVALRKIADKHNLRIIEDAAQAPLATLNGEYVGALSDIGGFSLNYHKHIHTGEGGVVVTNDDNLAKKAQMIRNHGENCHEFLKIDDVVNTLGLNLRLTEIQAAIGIEQLKKLPALVSHRRRLYKYFYEKMKDIECLSLEAPGDNFENSHYMVPVIYDSEKAGISRDQFVEAINAEFPPPSDFEDIPFFKGYTKPLYLNRIYQEKIAIGKNGFPFTSAKRDVDYSKGINPVCEEMFEKKLIYTPLIREPLSEADIDDFVGAILKVLELGNK